jgi:hypothetical protein
MSIDQTKTYDMSKNPNSFYHPSLTDQHLPIIIGAFDFLCVVDNMIDLKNWVVPIAMYLDESTLVCDKRKARNTSPIQALQAETKQQIKADGSIANRKQAKPAGPMSSENTNCTSDVQEPCL